MEGMGEGSGGSKIGRRQGGIEKDGVESQAMNLSGYG